MWTKQVIELVAVAEKHGWHVEAQSARCLHLARRGRDRKIRVVTILRGGQWLRPE
jgi:hypothetical protein